MPFPRLKIALVAGVCALTGGAAHAQIVDLVNADGNRLVSVDSARPGTVLRSVPITGLAAGQTIRGVDYNSSPVGLGGQTSLGQRRVLYAVAAAPGGQAQLYAINRVTGQAFAVTPAGTATTAITGTSFGVDVNPTVNRIRVVNDAEQNFRLIPSGVAGQQAGGLVANDATLAYRAGDAGAGTVPNVVGTAYVPNTDANPGATPPVAGTTTQYVIDSVRDVLATQGTAPAGAAGTPDNPNAGQLLTVGALGVNTNDISGFDIGRVGVGGTCGTANRGACRALATLTDPATNVSSLYSINLVTGAATLIGALPSSGGGATPAAYGSLAIAEASFASLSRTPNQLGVANAVDLYRGNPLDGEYQALLAGLDGLADVSVGLDQLTGQVHGAVSNVTVDQAVRHSEVIFERLDDYRIAGMARDGRAAGGRSGRSGFSVWAQVDGIFGEIDDDTNEAGLDYDSQGGMIGADFMFQNFVVGAAGAYSTANVDIDRLDGEADADGLTGILYAGTQLPLGTGVLSLSVTGSYTNYEVESSRGIVLAGAFNRQAQAEYDADQATIAARAGYAFSFDQVTVTPEVGVLYTNYESDDFTETGTANAVGLVVSEVEHDATIGHFGISASTAFSSGDAVIVPEFRVAYERDFNDDDREFQTRFVGIDGPGFTIRSGSVSEDRAQVGGGLDVLLSNGVQLYADYNAYIADEGTSHQLGAGARARF